MIASPPSIGVGVVCARQSRGIDDEAAGAARADGRPRHRSAPRGSRRRRRGAEGRAGLPLGSSSVPGPRTASVPRTFDASTTIPPHPRISGRARSRQASTSSPVSRSNTSRVRATSSGSVITASLRSTRSRRSTCASRVAIRRASLTSDRDRRPRTSSSRPRSRCSAYVSIAVGSRSTFPVPDGTTQTCVAPMSFRSSRSSAFGTRTSGFPAGTTMTSTGPKRSGVASQRGRFR